MKLSGWKRQAGAAASMPLVASMLAQQFFGLDTDELNKWLMVVSAVGLPLWGVGWIDKVLPFTVQVEKLLEVFNGWAKKQKAGDK